MEKKKIKIGELARNTFLLAFGLVWFAFVIFVIGSPPPTADCTGKTQSECKVLQKKIDDDHMRKLNNLLIHMG